LRIVFEYKLIVKFQNKQKMHHSKAYFYAVFIFFMKEKNLYFLMIGIYILLCPALIIASQKQEGTALKVEQLSTISQDNSITDDIELSDLFVGNLEAQIKIVREEIVVPTKTLNCSKYINVQFFNKNIKNQLSNPVIQEFIPNYHSSIIFRGMLLI